MYNSKRRNNPSTDIQRKTCETILYTMIKMQKDKVLKSLGNSKFPEDSVMVMYINRVIKVNILNKLYIYQIILLSLCVFSIST